MDFKDNNIIGKNLSAPERLKTDMASQNTENIECNKGQLKKFKNRANVGWMYSTEKKSSMLTNLVTCN